MDDKRLHIVSFDIPYPPNYGGVIDVYYKLAALSARGIAITLHCFEYPGRSRHKELEKLCTQVHYYPRHLGLRHALSARPYIVNGRQSEEMVANLLLDDAPILFEGLHSCYYLDDKRIQKRYKIYRESNIEHHYYFHLFLSEKHLFKKSYYLSASLKLKLFQKILSHADMMLAVSRKDAEYLTNHFPKKKVEFLPSFHGNYALRNLTGTGDFVLYHGNLEVPENEKAATFLVKQVFAGQNIPFIIAGMNPTMRLRKLCRQHNVSLIENPDANTMDKLVREAHINILYTFQDTGMKLKLVNALYNGRHCLVNHKMVNGSDLHSLCHIAGSPAELQKALQELMETPFSSGMKEKRSVILNIISDQSNATRLIQLVFHR